MWASDNGKPAPSSLPRRSRRYGVGKEIGGSVYVHRQYEDRLGPTVAIAKRWLPADHAYDVVKYNRRIKAVSFIRCPGFDVESEPSIGSVVTVRSDGTLQRRAVSRDPLIYHHKWLFVEDDYSGFDVEESKRRSVAWLTLPNVDKPRIGRSSYWQTQVVPRLSRDDHRSGSLVDAAHIHQFRGMARRSGMYEALEDRLCVGQYGSESEALTIQPEQERRREEAVRTDEAHELPASAGKRRRIPQREAGE